MKWRKPCEQTFAGRRAGSVFGNEGVCLIIECEWGPLGLQEG